MNLNVLGLGIFRPPTTLKDSLRVTVEGHASVGKNEYAPNGQTQNNVQDKLNGKSKCRIECIICQQLCKKERKSAYYAQIVSGRTKMKQAGLIAFKQGTKRPRDKERRKNFLVSL